MKAKLRPYQQEWVGQVCAALSAAPAARVMGQLPTGGGKTISACAVIEDWQRARPDARVCWVTHRRELIAQSADVLAAQGVAAFAAGASVWKPGSPLPLLDGVAVTSPAILRNRDYLSSTGADDLLVLDEAHHAAAKTWSELLESHQGAALGLTATPWRLSKKQGFEHLFDTLIEGPQIADLITAGALARFRMFTPRADRQMLVSDGDKSSTGDYKADAVYRRNEPTGALSAEALDMWLQYGGDEGLTLIYALTVRHATVLAGVWRAAGHPAEVLTADTPSAERDGIMRRYRAGEVRTLINVGIATEGFDVGGLSCVVMMRPTTSLALYLQMVGRALRPTPSGEPALILDMAGNAARHGRPDRRRTWSLAPRNADAGGGEMVAKSCLAVLQDNGAEPRPCMSVNPAAARVCVECGAPFGRDCPHCGRFLGWAQWLDNATRCLRCITAAEQAYLEFSEPWRVSRKGNHYRSLDSRRTLMVLGWSSPGLRPAGVLYEDGKITDRILLDGAVPDRPDWYVYGRVERWAGVTDRPPGALDLLNDAVAAYQQGEPDTARALLLSARYAYGAAAVRHRIDKGLSMTEVN